MTRLEALRTVQTVAAALGKLYMQCQSVELRSDIIEAHASATSVIEQLADADLDNRPEALLILAHQFYHELLPSVTGVQIKTQRLIHIFLSVQAAIRDLDKVNEVGSYIFMPWRGVL